MLLDLIKLIGMLIQIPLSIIVTIVIIIISGFIDFIARLYSKNIRYKWLPVVVSVVTLYTFFGFMLGNQRFILVLIFDIIYILVLGYRDYYYNKDNNSFHPYDDEEFDANAWHEAEEKNRDYQSFYRENYYRNHSYESQGSYDGDYTNGYGQNARRKKRYDGDSTKRKSGIFNNRFSGMSPVEAKKKYRELMKKYHPDNAKTGDVKMAQKIKEEYEDFKDSE